MKNEGAIMEDTEKDMVTTLVVEPRGDSTWEPIVMTIPHDGLSPRLQKAKETKRWEDLIAYLDQLEHMLAKMLGN